MIQILKANLIRLFKNWLYLGGLVVAAVLTYYISRADMELFVLHHINHNECMKLISGAVYAFIAIFVPVFEGTEFSDGTIRNKFIMGHSADEFYLAHLLTSFLMMVVMEAVWFVSGLLAGARVDADLLAFALMTAFAMFSFCAFMTFLQMVIRTTAACAGTGVVLFYALFFMGLIGNYLFSFQGDKMFTKILLFILNASPVGEWFLHSYLGASEPNDFGYTMSYGLVPHLILCIVFAALFTIIGIRSLKRKDLK
ncbi:MAG: hypothetical protein K6E81_04210 [Lachnospiraceae bacterium]|nr:hypothetical protein [Lachnospiraceae bacterium]